MANNAKTANNPETQEDRLRGMDRSFAVLELIAATPMRVIDVTKALGLPWATVHRTLTQLERAQFLRKDKETNRFEIGPRLWHIGSAYLSNHLVLNAAIPHLNQSEEIAEIVVQIVERIGNTSVAIYSAQKQSDDITKAHYGFHFPLHCGAKGQVLLANESSEFIDRYLGRDLEALTNDTETNPEKLRNILQDIRQTGFAFTVGDVQPFTASVAAPIRDASGKVAAALAYVFRKPLSRNEKRVIELQEQLIHAAHSISFNMGWRPGQS